MAPESTNPFAQEFHGQTTIHPLGLALALAMGLLVLTVPRRYAVWPVIVVVCFIASAQRLVIAGADFTLLRLLVLFGTARLLTNQDYRGLRWNSLDTAVVLWATAFAGIPVVRIGTSVLMNRAGLFYDAVGLYFIFRAFIRDWDDVRNAIRGLMWASLAVASFVLLEWQTGRNGFAIFGGVPELTVMRDGRMRCQAAFDHPLLLGSFFAALMPLAAACWWQRHCSRALVITSCVACLLIVLATGSATPVTGLMAAFVGAALFGLRHWMRWIRWGVVLVIVVLHFVMNAPVWHLIARVSVVGGNSSWHRFALVDGAIRHIDEWWLLGSDLGTAHWGHFTFDATNQYVVMGQHGGLLLLSLFIGLIVIAFRAVGRTWRRVEGDRRLLILTWGIGLALWVNVVNLFGVAYFGQIWMGWYLVLGMIGSMQACGGAAVRDANPRNIRRGSVPSKSASRSVTRDGREHTSTARAATAGDKLNDS